MDRPKQDVPADLVNRLMAVVRNQFCTDMAGDEWGKHSHFVKRNVILWPAHFICNVKGFTITAERYEAIMRGVFQDIKRHGQTGDIRYWPGYLMKCVQDHWKHHWEEYYQQSKSLQSITDHALLSLKRLPDASDRAVDALASAHSVLTSKSKPRRAVFKPKEQALPGF